MKERFTHSLTSKMRNSRIPRDLRSHCCQVSSLPLPVSPTDSLLSLFITNTFHTHCPQTTQSSVQLAKAQLSGFVEFPLYCVAQHSILHQYPLQSCFTGDKP